MCVVISLVISFLVLTRPFPYLLTPVLVIKQQMLGQVWKQDIIYIFFPSALSTWSFLPPAPTLLLMCSEGTAQPRERLQHTPCMEESLHPFLKLVWSLSTLHAVLPLHCTRPRRFFSLIWGSVIETVSYTVNCWISHALVCVRSSHHLALFPAWERGYPPSCFCL